MSWEPRTSGRRLPRKLKKRVVSAVRREADRFLMGYHFVRTMGQVLGYAFAERAP